MPTSDAAKIFLTRTASFMASTMMKNGIARWGYDLPMFVCGTKHSHVDNVYHLKKKFNSSAKEMLDVVDILTPQQRTRYGTGYSKTDFSVLDNIYEKYKKGVK